MEKRYYLAYGSNLNLDQMQWRCPRARVVGRGFIHDYALLFKGSLTGSYLTIEPKAGSIVPVAVWQVTEEDEKRLDRYEGYPTFYYKKDMEIEYEGIRTHIKRNHTAFVYIMHEDRALGIPSFAYLQTCLSGYRDFGFDTRFLSDAIARSKGETV